MAPVAAAVLARFGARAAWVLPGAAVVREAPRLGRPEPARPGVRRQAPQAGVDARLPRLPGRVAGGVSTRPSRVGSGRG